MIEFTDWLRMNDPLPNTSCFVRKMVHPGGEPHLVFKKMIEVPCWMCEGTGIIKKGSYEWEK